MVHNKSWRHSCDLLVRVCYTVFHPVKLKAASNMGCFKTRQLRRVITGKHTLYCYHKSTADSLFITHSTVTDRTSLGEIKLNELGKQKLQAVRNPVSRRSMKSYIQTYYTEFLKTLSWWCHYDGEENWKLHVLPTNTSIIFIPDPWISQNDP